MRKRNGEAAPEEFFKHVLSRDYGMLDRLLAQGFDINSAGRDGMTTLMIAVLDGSMDMVDYLIEKGANIDDHHIGIFGLPHNALSVAYTMKPVNYLMVKYLLLKGARYDSGDLLLVQEDPGLNKLFKEFKRNHSPEKIQVDLFGAIERLPYLIQEPVPGTARAEETLKEAGIV